MRPGTPASDGLRWTLSLLLVCVTAKLLVLPRLAATGGPSDFLATPVRAAHVLTSVLATIGSDLALACALGALVCGLGVFLVQTPRRRLWVARLGHVGYALLVAWLGLNVAVGQVLTWPITASMLHGTGGALADSFARHATFANLAPPVGLGLLGAVAPWALARFPVGLRVHPAVVAAALLATSLAATVTGSMALARAQTRGLHANPILALLTTTWRRQRAQDDDERFSRRLPPCSADPATPAGLDLHDLTGAARGRNVVWVILESTPARALSLYGGTRETTPHLATLARSGSVAWEHAYAVYPESIKGLFSVLCSRTPPPDSEASEYEAKRVPCTSIAQAFADAGYRTGLFHSGRFAYLGMDAVVQGRGFGALDDAATIPSAHTSSFGVDDRATADALLRWIDGEKASHPAGAVARPFFAVYMPIAGHHPYHAPGMAPRPFPEHSERDEHANDLFGGDEAFGRLRAGLESRGLDAQTLYVVFGDHGEAFREHPGNVAHALHLYEENLHVPFFVAAPGLFEGARRAPQVTSLLDVAPTTLALLGLPSPPGAEGRPALTPGPAVARAFTEQGARRAALIDGRHKLIVDRETDRAELFDLLTDPDERVDRALSQPTLVRRYRACLEPAPPASSLASLLPGR